MDITLMEKAYKDDYVLYINGLVGTVSDRTMISAMIEALTHLDYNIKDVNHILSLNDDVPNNEADYWHEGPNKPFVNLVETSWTHRCYQSCCFESGYKINVNGKDILTNDSIAIELLQVLDKLGHPVAMKKNMGHYNFKSGFAKGSCTSALTEDRHEHNVS